MRYPNIKKASHDEQRNQQPQQTSITSKVYVRFKKQNLITKSN